MAIRPVELQGVVQRSQDIGQIKQNQDQKPLTDQSNIQIHMKHEGQQKNKQVTKFQDSDKKENRYDAKEKGNGPEYRREHKKKKEIQENEEDMVIMSKTGRDTFDVKI